MLAERIRRHGTKVYLVNTGWVGGDYGVGERISLKYTRAMVSAALSGALGRSRISQGAHFGLMIPTRCPGVPDEVFDPESDVGRQGRVCGESGVFEEAVRRKLSAV